MKFTGGDRVNNTIEGWSPLTEEELVGNSRQRFSFALQFHCMADVDVKIGNWSFDPYEFTYYVNIYTQYGNFFFLVKI